ncbi:MAG: ABC-type uncharacterized transport system involved in gliding motility auxiliary subunit, partial [Paracoccaceae bacterium]
PGPKLAHATKRALRWNALLSIVLLGLIVVFANLLAGRHLRIRTDLSEDGLNAMSDATKRIVDRIGDRVTVRLYVTEAVEDGQLALRTARIRSQLEELLQLRPDVFELQTLDPTRSSEAQRNAVDAGFRPMRAQAAALEGGGSGEPVWLSMELSYRARTEQIPTPRPFEFETQFASALHSLLADRKPGIGWVGARIEPVPTQDSNAARIAEADPTYRLLRLSLERRAKFSVLEGLETGRSVPDDIDVIFVVRPSGLPESTVRELDRFVQRGGRLVVCIDDPDYNTLLGTATFSPDDLRSSAFGKLLFAWGIRVATTKQIWDGEWQAVRAAVTTQSGGSRLVQVRSPMVITVPDEGLSDAVSPTRGVERVQFSWAHPIVPEAIVPVPEGLVREDLVWTSEDARLDEIMPLLSTDSRELRNRMTYLRQKDSARHVIGAAFSGLFPSPLAGGAGPGVPRKSSQVVVFGDADWLRDPWSLGEQMLVPFTAAGGLVLAENLVDWLTLDEELIGLRSRAPKPRPLRDFLTEELQEAGVFERDPFETGPERIERDRNSDRARQLARGKQWLTMLLPAGGALLILALFGAAWNLLQRPRSKKTGAKR